jgi:glycosyltransferase involved in cell wall biosynthesis
MGWKTGEIVEMLQRPELKGRVVHVGFVRERADIAAFYSAADVFVFPTLYEGFGLPVLEAMTCGCPVVTSNNTSIPEVAGDAALCVDAEDDAAIASAVRRVLDDAGLRETLVARGIEQARKFSWQSCASVTLEVYKGLR